MRFVIEPHVLLVTPASLRSSAGQSSASISNAVMPMKLNPSTQPLTSAWLPEVQALADSSVGYYVMIVTDHYVIYETHLRSSTKSAADQYTAQFATQNKLNGVALSQWPKRMRDEMFRRFVKAHRREDHATTTVLSHVVATLIGSQVFALGVTRRGKLKWARAYATGSAADLRARVKELLKTRSHHGAQGVIANVVHSPHFFASQAQVRRAEWQIQALQANSKDIDSGKFFDPDIVLRHD
jgi:hypothetical protein